jgi:hypothetical protein
MGKYQQQYMQALCAQSTFYRRTAKGQKPGTSEYVSGLSPYLHDVFTMCAEGISELELRQFMPPASLQASVASLLELGLIECVERHAAVAPQRAANQRAFAPALMMA